MHALIVDDEAPARRRLLGVLRALPAITRLEQCATGHAAVEALKRSPPDLLFLDIRMPDLSGFDVLTRLPIERMPAVIFVTAHEDFAARAFAVHAFDYLLKPFEDERVIEAVRRAAGFLEWIRNGAGTVPDRFGDVQVDIAAHRVLRSGVPVPLRPKDYTLLLALLRRGGRVVTRAELLREVWGYADDVESRTIDTHVARLRRALESDPAHPRHIITVRPVGYRFDP